MVAFFIKLCNVQPLRILSGGRVVATYESELRDFSIKLSEDEEHYFNDLSGLKDWLDKQNHAWGTLIGELLSITSTVPEELHEATQRVSELTRQCERYSRSRKSLSHEEQVGVNRFKEELNGLFSVEYLHLPIAQSPRLNELLAFLKKGEISDFEHLVLKIFKKPVGERGSIAEKLNEKKIQELVSELKELSKVKGTLQTLKDERANFISRIESLENSKTSTEEDQRLEKANSFWNTKSESHFKRFLLYLFLILFWISGSFCVLLHTLSQYAKDIKYADNIFELLPYIPKNALLILLAVWGTRVLLRLLLSENHLKTRAEEKKILIQTYVELVKDGLANTDERHIVLGSVFSLSQDGLVSDDNMPRPSMNPINLYNDIAHPTGTNSKVTS